MTAGSRLADRLSLLGFRAGWAGVRAMPAGSAYRLFDALADLTYRRDTRDVRRLRANYARVRPELDPPALEDLVRAGMRSYLRYWCEAFRLPEVGAEELHRQVRAVGVEAPRRDLAAGSSVIAFLGHLGNWDVAGAWSPAHLGPVTTVAERLRPEELFGEFLAFREGLGMTILPLTGGPPPFPALLAAARDGGRVIPLLADRDLTSQGVTVPFCGHPARMAPGPSALALASGAPLYPVGVHYEPVPRAEHVSGYRTVITFLDRVPDPGIGTTRERVEAMTAACATALGQTVRAHTHDWHMMQRVFADTVDGAPFGLPRRDARGA